VIQSSSVVERPRLLYLAANINDKLNARISMSWSDNVFFVHPHRDARQVLIEQLQQDGFCAHQLKIPPLGSEEFLQLMQDAEKFAAEVGSADAWKLRSARWLNRFACGVTGKTLLELPPISRQAIAHAAIVMAGHAELLR
jgi:hypothetical protein